MNCHFEVGDLVIDSQAPYQSWNPKKYHKLTAEDLVLLPCERFTPIPINGKDDAGIYADVVVAATSIRHYEEIPVMKTHDEYYMEHFDIICFENGYTLKDIIEGKNFNFVHEIQQFLRNSEYGQGITLRF